MPLSQHASWRQRFSGFNVVHGFRVGLLIGVIALIHADRESNLRVEAGRSRDLVTRVELQSLYPQASEVNHESSRHGGCTVLDRSGRVLGYVIQTSPASDRVVGYSGSTNMLLAFDAEDRLLDTRIVSSRDTVDHVAMVKREYEFLRELRGRTWQEIAAGIEVEAVSGATLTSLAIVEGITTRLGGSKPALRFPQPLDLKEVQGLLPNADRVEELPNSPGVHAVLDRDGKRIGTVLRSSPAADSVMGYQGPTDSILAFDDRGRALRLSVRSSYDNQPYVGYVRDDEYFTSRFQGRSLSELAAGDLKSFEIEGVSGATMTSQAVARGVFRAATSALEKPPTVAMRRAVFRGRDWGTLAILGMALVMCFSRWRGNKWFRFGFQFVLIVYFGFMNGDLLSQAQLAGWSANGVPWRLAPGLALLTAASLIVPAVTKRQLYCHHICPFGAMQQIVRSRLPWQIHLGRPLAKGLAIIPGILLLLVLVVTMNGWEFDLAGIEPFDAFLFWIAGAGTIAVALVGLTASLFVPMAYCRFGCPTGAVLGYARRQGGSSRFLGRDYFAIFLLLLALGLRWW